MLARFVQSLPNGIAQTITHYYFKAIAWQSRGILRNMSSSTVAGMEVVTVPALRDNYMYLLIDKSSLQAAVVDPVQPQELLRLIQERGLTLSMALITHHHDDHSGGNRDLLKVHPELPVLSADTRVPGTTRLLQHGDTAQLGALVIKALFTPAHTLGSVCYVVSEKERPLAVFTGDTLFSAGCGRLFEGTPQQLLGAMDQLGALPPDTHMFPGHEYTVANLKFAAHVQPNNEQVKERTQWALQKMEKSEPTIPSTIGDELQFNPFMRARHPQLAQGETDPVLIIKKLRQDKDNFKG